jgi:bla regulator protein blaR1
MIAWMLYGLLMSGLVAVAAVSGETLVRSRGLPVRLVWLAALAGVAVISVFPLRESAGPPLTGPSVTLVTEISGYEASTAPGSSSGFVALIREATRAPLRAAVELGGGAMDDVLAASWVLGTSLLLILGALTVLRYRGARRRWPRAEVAGVRARVAPESGPAVIGVMRGEIVVPRWLLDASPEEQRLVMAHEAEHVRARDPLVLTLGAVALALVPWNPIAWWMMHRLRLAVEMDCDARVLARGAEVRTYGEMLIEMAGRSAGLPLRAAVLAASSSTLERRLKAMFTRPSGTGPVRMAGLGLLGAVALFTACEARMPTAAEVDGMDVAAVEQRVALFTEGSDDPNTVYYVDGKQVTAEEARALTASSVAEVEVRKRAPDGPSTIRIRTTASGDGAESGALRIRGLSEGDMEAAILFIDGVRVEPSRLRALRPEDIRSIEVIKGEGAVTRFGDPAAANGVIRVTTKAAPAQNP